MICIGPALPESVVRQAADWREQLIVVNEPSHDLIEALYVSAQALLFPSLDEGFGWPIIEAQACGCPVITSDREPMRTIAGPAALLIDPDRLDEAAATIAARWDWLLAQRDAARTHARSFSDAAAARRYADLLAAIAGQLLATPERAS
jgi:glycosyltransferase involved in cell wall biosynthesis